LHKFAGFHKYDRRGGQRGLGFGEHFRKFRKNVGHKEKNYARRYQAQSNRIYQGGLDLGPYFSVAFGKFGDALEHFVEARAGFSGLDHIGGDFVENLRMSGYGIVKRLARGDSRFHVVYNGFEIRVLGLVYKRLQAFYKSYARGNKGGKLYVKIGDFLLRDPVEKKARQRRRSPRLFLHFFYFDNVVTFFYEGIRQRAGAGRFGVSRLHLVAAVGKLIFK